MSALLVVGAIAVPSVASSDESTPYPIGVVSSSEPSGYAPPSADAMPGYSLTYVNDFTGTTVPAGWGVFTGTPSGDPGSQWESSQVVVSGGMLQLNAAQDPALNNEWITGGLCQCGQSQTYGAYFVRSRETGPGPTIVELLWPTQGWPPEIDFIETGGVTTDATATNIWGLDSSGNKEQQQDAITIDMTQWHTWGVVWTPTSITYTVDGQAWGTFTVPSEIPSQPMSLHIQQQTWCSAGFACPTSPEST
ncbi:MAG: glycoside hydrolase family 16 protein, partial [Acidimicrobiales bacterium]